MFEGLLAVPVPTQVFSSEYSETFKNTWFEEYLPTAASADGDIKY